MGDSAALRQDRVGATFLGVAAHQGADAVQYVEAGVVVFATLAIAWAADQLAGRRGVGLATGVELVHDRTSKAPAGDVMHRLLNLIRDEGALVGGEGILGNVLKIRPPIVFSRDNADFAVAAIDRALDRL